jgi:hypothetical protein
VAGRSIRDIVAINDTNYLLATYRGLFKNTKDSILNHYFKEEQVSTLCHIADSIYLVGFDKRKLIVWNEQTV